MEMSRHWSLKGKSEYLLPLPYEGDQTWLICSKSADGHCSFLQNESSQEPQVWAEDWADGDELDNSLLN